MKRRLYPALIALMLGASFQAGAQTVQQLADTAASQIHADVDQDAFGRSVAIIGDVNGDGRDDMLIGASSDRNSSVVPAAFVVYGTATGALPADIDVATLDGSNGFSMHLSQSGTRLGHGVTGLGDINNDGIEDFAVGAPFADAGTSPSIRDGAGKVFVVFGRGPGNPFPADFDLATLNGSNGFVIEGVYSDDHIGHALASAGDFNGDGIPDLIFGSSSASGTDEAWIVLGRSTGFPARVDLTTLTTNSQGFRLVGSVNTQFGRSVAGIGDMDADTRDDVLVGAPHYTPASDGNAGRVYAVHGRATSSASGANVLDLESPTTPGVQRLDGVGAGAFAGAAVAGTGDINGDDVRDFIIGAPGFNGYEGVAWVVFGDPALASGSLATMTSNGQAFRIHDSTGGYNTNRGAAVSGGEDFDGDGIDDIVLGVPGGLLRSGEKRNGAVYILPGRAASDPWPMMLDLDNLSTGLRLDGVTDVGSSGIGNMLEDMSLSLGPDVDGDGRVDLLIGSPKATATTSDKTNGPWQGRAWLVNGSGLSASDVIFRDGFDGS